MKKLFLFLAGVSSILLLTACQDGNNETKTEKEAETNNPLAGISEKDVVSEEEVEIEGERMVIKKLKDGTNITLPPGMTIDDAKKQQETGDDHLSVYEEEE